MTIFLRLILVLSFCYAVVICPCFEFGRRVCFCLNNKDITVVNDSGVVPQRTLFRGEISRVIGTICQRAVLKQSAIRKL